MQGNNFKCDRIEIGCEEVNDVRLSYESEGNVMKQR